MIFYLFYFIIRHIQRSYKMKGLINIVFHYFNSFSNIDIILSFWSGILSAKYDFMSIFNNSDINSFYYSLFSIFSSIFIRCNLINKEGSTRIDFFIVPLFILPITSLISKNKTLFKVLSLFGKHSTNFWFLHGYFYDNYYIKLLAFPKYSFLCYIWLVVLTLISSYIVNIILIPVINYINFILIKFHRMYHFLYQKKYI